MLGALGGVSLVAMPFSYRIDRRLVPLQWAVTVAIMTAYTAGAL